MNIAERTPLLVEVIDCGDPFGFEEDTAEEEIQMSDDDCDDLAYDVPVSGTTLRSLRRCVNHFIARPFMRSVCARAQPAKREGCTASDSWNQRLGTHPCHLSRSVLNGEQELRAPGLANRVKYYLIDLTFIFRLVHAICITICAYKLYNMYNLRMQIVQYV
jgi:hypothetical protein